MQLFGQEITTDHAKLAGSLLGGLLAFGGFVAGRWSSHLQRSRLEKEDLVSTAIVVEMVSRPANGGDPEILTASRTTSLEDFFQNGVLVTAIRKAARKHPGLLRLHDPAAHRLMMVEAGNWLQGLNSQANLDFIAGRDTDLHEVLIGLAAYPAGAAGAGHLHDEVDQLVLMVVNRAAAESLLAAPRHPPSDKPVSHLPKRIFDLIDEWDRVRNLEHDLGSERVWTLKLRISAPPVGKPRSS